MEIICSSVMCILQSSTMRPPKKRPGKVALEKGHSQLDWMRLQRSGKDLAGKTCVKKRNMLEIWSSISTANRVHPMKLQQKSARMCWILGILGESCGFLSRGSRNFARL